MHQKVFQFFATEYDALEDLPHADRELILAAREASATSYSPYSNFRVGAAVLLANGTVVKGSNQENADFTDGLCAERVALFYANSNYSTEAVKAMAVTAKNSKGLIDGPALPCGSCRQVLVETESRYDQAIRLVLDGAKKIMVIEGADNLLPFAFKPAALG